MSTKTSIKRIAAVAAVALTFGGFSAVSAHAADNLNITAISAGTSAPARVGVLGGTTAITITVPTGPYNDTVTAQIVSAPTTPAVSASAVLTFANGSGSTYPSGVSYSSSSSTAGVAKAVITNTTNGSSGKNTFQLSLNADVAGSYTILVTADGGASGYTTGAISTSYTITTAGAPTTLTLASYAGQVTNKDEATGGQLFKLTMKDANGNATVLGSNEAIKMSSADSSVTVVAGSSGTAFGAASDASGSYYTRVTGYSTLATGSSTLTATGSGLISSSVTTNASVTEQAVTYATTGTLACTTSTLCVANGSNNWYVSGSVGTTITVASSALSAATYFPLLVKDAAGKTFTDVISASTGTTATYASPSTSAAATAAPTIQVLTGAAAGPLLHLSKPEWLEQLSLIHI